MEFRKYFKFISQHNETQICRIPKKVVLTLMPGIIEIRIRIENNEGNFD